MLHPAFGIRLGSSTHGSSAKTSTQYCSITHTTTSCPTSTTAQHVIPLWYLNCATRDQRSQ
jgi:hypothetical protein